VRQVIGLTVGSAAWPQFVCSNAFPFCDSSADQQNANFIGLLSTKLYQQRQQTLVYLQGATKNPAI